MEKNPFDLERFLVCDENLPKKRKNDENLWIYMKNLNSG
jgi:hypothetical protein